jgi:hypothetical protein
METLGYTHMAMLYEESVGPLGIQRPSLRLDLDLRRVSSAVAIAGLIILGGFTTLVTSVISRPAGAPVPHHTSGF